MQKLLPNKHIPVPIMLLKIIPTKQPMPVMPNKLIMPNLQYLKLSTMYNMPLQLLYISIIFRI